MATPEAKGLRGDRRSDSVLGRFLGGAILSRDGVDRPAVTYPVP